jgi:hypothetical protein
MLLALGLVEEDELCNGAGQSVAKMRLSMSAALACKVPPFGHSIVERMYSSAACWICAIWFSVADVAEKLKKNNKQPIDLQIFL